MDATTIARPTEGASDIIIASSNLRGITQFSSDLSTVSPAHCFGIRALAAPPVTSKQRAGRSVASACC
jgi:hypothetical protein